MSKNFSPSTTQNEPLKLNTRQRKAIARQAKKSARRGSPASKAPTDQRQIAGDVHVYTDDSYKDKAKRVYSSGLKQARERIAAINAKFDLPERIATACQPIHTILRRWRKNYTTAVIINRDGKARSFLPDKPGRHVILCHRSIARHLVSACCMLVRITANEDKEGNNIDGSWAIVPAQYAMMKATTIQHLKRRPFFFLRRYWYEISFDGRVQPAHLLFDYNISPLQRKTRLYVTHEYVPVRKRDETNDYFRFWRERPTANNHSSQ